MRRSLSAGAAGIVFLGTAVVVAGADQPEQVTADSGVVISTSTLQTIAHAYDGQTKLTSWGVPANILVAPKPAPAEEVAPAAEEVVPAEEASAKEVVAEEAPAQEIAPVEESVEEVPALNCSAC